MRRRAATGLGAALAAVLAVLLVAEVAGARPWGWLGVRIRDLSEHEMDEISARHGLREGFGVVIVEVIEDTPAARIGVRTGDIVVAFEDRPVTDTRTLQRIVAGAPLDRETELTVLRPEGRQRLAVQLAAMPAEVAGERVAVEFGFVLRPAEATAASLPRERAPGLVVAVVVPRSPAERVGLRVGDVVAEVGGRAVERGEDARAILAETPTDRPLQLTVRRAESRLTLTLSPP